MREGSRIIEVECKCGQRLARYEKVGKGRLQKMYLDMILKDRAGVFSDDFEINQDIFCPGCNKRVATIKGIHGKLAAKMNQGAIKPIRT